MDSCAHELDAFARQRFGVAFKAGSIFACPGKMRDDDGHGQELARSLRICIAFYDEETLEEALDRLHLAILHQQELRQGVRGKL